MLAQLDLVFNLAFLPPLALAAEKGHRDVVEALLAARSDPELHWRGLSIHGELERSSPDKAWGFLWDQRFAPWRSERA